MTHPNSGSARARSSGRFGVLRAMFLALPLLAAVLLLAQVANAASLGLDSTGKYPDLTSGGSISYSHDGSTGLFEVDDAGIMIIFWAGGASNDFLNATYDLDASFDSSGNFSGGTITVTGASATANPTWSGPNILTATLTDFGFQGDGAAGVFEFVFGGATGDMTQFGHSGGGIIISTFDLAGTGISGIWDPDDDGEPGFLLDDFSGSANSVDTFVPVPAAAWLFGSGLLGLIGIGRRVRPVCRV